MDSRRLVVWLSAGILGFQGGTLVLDLIHCSVLSWLYVRRCGLELVASGVSVEQRPPEGIGRVDPVNAPASQRQPLAPAPATASASSVSEPPTSPRAVPIDPTEVFCSRSRHRVDTAVGQGLSILAGLALGGTVGGGGRGEERP